jgi:hypothetical protein
MLSALTTAQRRRVSLALLLAAGALAGAAALIGIADNPPGILTVYGAAALLVLSIVHPWRSARPFALLAAGGVLASLAFAVLHNLLDGAAELLAVPILSQVLGVLSAGAFLLAVLVCPAVVLVAAGGALVQLVRSLSHRPA